MYSIITKDGRLENAFTYQQFMELAKQKAEAVTQGKQVSEDPSLDEHRPLNMQRAGRVEKTTELTPELAEIVQKIDATQYWVVITEDWCGDSAQNLPVLHMIASANPTIRFSILERDKNPDLIDMYLTNGTRSIPILVAFNETGEELFRWGPRPAAAAEIIRQAKAEGLEKEEMYNKLHLWYAKDRGRHLQAEFVTLLKSLR